MIRDSGNQVVPVQVITIRKVMVAVSNDKVNEKCTRCNHWLDQRHRQCPAMSAKCRYCSNVGHYEIVCRKKSYDSRNRSDYSRKPNVHEVSRERVEQVEYFLGTIFTDHKDCDYN